MQQPETNQEVHATAGLNALVWVLSDDARAGRLLALTGLSPEALRARIGDPALIAAVIRFLEAHEPDLLACAEAIGVTPTHLVDARRSLER